MVLKSVCDASLNLSESFVSTKLFAILLFINPKINFIGAKDGEYGGWNIFLICVLFSCLIVRVLLWCDQLYKIM